MESIKAYVRKELPHMYRILAANPSTDWEKMSQMPLEPMFKRELELAKHELYLAERGTPVRRRRIKRRR